MSLPPPTLSFVRPLSIPSPTALSSASASLASSLASLSASLSQSLSTILSQPIPLWLCLLTSLTTALTLRLHSALSQPSRLPSSRCDFHSSCRLSYLHFRQCWLQYDVDRSGFLSTQEALALLDLLSRQARDSGRLQAQYVQEIVRRAEGAAAASAGLPAGVAAEAAEVVKAAFDKMQRDCPAVFHHFLQHLQAAGQTPVSSEQAERQQEAGREERKEKEADKEERKELDSATSVSVDSSLSISSPVFSLPRPRLSAIDYRSLCVLYGCYVESQLAAAFTAHFRMTG